MTIYAHMTMPICPYAHMPIWPYDHMDSVYVKSTEGFPFWQWACQFIVPRRTINQGKRVKGLMNWRQWSGKVPKSNLRPKSVLSGALHRICLKYYLDRLTTMIGKRAKKPFPAKFGAFCNTPHRLLEIILNPVNNPPPPPPSAITSHDSLLWQNQQTFRSSAR